MNSSKKGLRISFNAPATLTFAALCVIARIISILTMDDATRLLFSVSP